MKVGIIGLPQTGKKTLFQILTGNEITDPAKAFKPVPGTADILDSRFNILVDMYEPNKQGTCWLAGAAPPAGKHYYFVKVTQADGNLMWSAPVWVTVAGE